MAKNDIVDKVIKIIICVYLFIVQWRSIICEIFYPAFYMMAIRLSQWTMYVDVSLNSPIGRALEI